MSSAETLAALRPSRGSSRALYRKLRAGRRGLNGPSNDEVASHQRARLHGAMVRAVATDGYEATTVRRLSALAGVSTRTLYDVFADGKRECLLSAYDAAMRRMARRIVLAYVSERQQERRLARGLEAFAHEVYEEPAVARLVLVEIFAAGPAALDRMEHTHRLFEGIVDLSFRQAPGGAVSPPLVVKGVVAGVARVARVRLLNDRAAELPALTAELLEWMLSYRSSAAATLVDLGSAGGQVAPAVVDAGRRERGDERARILDAAARLAAQEGYASLTTARIAVAAGVSRRRFEAHFEDVRGCFVAAFEWLTDRALAHATAAGAASPSWAGAVHRALCALCAYVAGDPLFARLEFVEVFASGPDGVRLRAHVIGDVAERFRASVPAGCRPSQLAAEASMGAVWGIIHHHVVHGMARRLPDITPQLSFMTLAPVLGANDTVQAIRAEHARMQAASVAA
jgi:AcrR family transcriptional regulator